MQFKLRHQETKGLNCYGEIFWNVDVDDFENIDFNGSTWIDEFRGMVSKVISKNGSIQKRFIEILTEYLINGSLDSVSPHRVSMEQRLSSGDWLLSAEFFILGHEYGHLILGHLSDEAAPVRCAVGNMQVEIFSKSHSDELWADMFGAAIVIKWSINDKSAQDHPSLLPNLLCGPTLFFECSNLIERSLQLFPKYIKKRENTHPESSVRNKRVNDLLFNLIGDTQHRQATLIKIILHELYSSMQSDLRKAFSSAGRPAFIWS